VRDDPFVAYGPSHLAAIAVLAAGIVGFLVFGRWARRRFDRAFAVAIVVIAVPMQLVQFTGAEWDLQTSLPLQLCDWGWLAATVALWSRSRLAATITYLWGLTLTSQAIMTPALTTPFPGLRWWMFWALHLLIVWAAIHVVWGMKLHPTWTTYGQTVVITLTWLFVTVRFNVLAGTNYGYLNDKPAQTSALDLLGPWPGYVLAEIVIVLAAWALLTWPWTRKPADEPLVLDSLQ
jgi:hypothetical integral membrane protein (TIGR02206 family)